MDNVITKQYETGKEIATLVVNTKKDSKDRKDANYIQRRREKLGALWNEFKTRHIEVVKYEQPEHEYFTKKFYEQVELKKEELQKLLVEYEYELQSCNSDPLTIEQQPKKSATKMVVDNVSAPHYKKQRFRFSSLTQQIEQIDLSTDIHQAEIDFHSKNLMEAWKNIESLHEEILVIDNENSSEFTKLTNEYEQLQSKLREALLQLQKKKQEESPTEKDIRLPRLSIPIFEGKFDSWRAFHDIFVRLIHNNNKLADVEKMQYLKTS